MIRIHPIIFIPTFVAIVMSCASKNQTLVKEHVTATVETARAEKINFLQEETVELSAPRVTIDSLLFIESATVSAVLDLEGSALSYALDSGISQNYTAPFQVTESKLVEVWAEKLGFINSTPLSINLIKVSNKTTEATVSLTPSPNKNYPGNGAQSLMDLQKGSLNFKEGNHWSGFQNLKTEIDIKLTQPQKLTKVYCSILEDHGAWIFLPQEIQIWNRGKQLGSKIILVPEATQSARMKFITVELPEGSYTELKVLILNQAGIPEWHQGAGTPPWLFIDEIIVE